MSTFLKNLPVIRDSRIAVGLSGGPDSMALAHVLAIQKGCDVFAITVDHGLRDNSEQEAETVGLWVKEWPNLTHVILKWETPPESRIMEEARKARYELMANYCDQNGIGDLYLAHHMDDQAETFLLRLAAGSGLDGLSGMMPEHKYNKRLTLMRPFLRTHKDELIAYCHHNNIPFVNDPSNEKSEYARPRLRSARHVLEQEGLSSKRLSVTAWRLSRARTALEQMTEQCYARMCVEDDRGVLINWEALKKEPEEIILRVLMRAMNIAGPEREYAPRMEKTENLLQRLLYEAGFKGATLGGCKFAWQTPRKALYISPE